MPSCPTRWIAARFTGLARAPLSVRTLRPESCDVHHKKCDSKKSRSGCRYTGCVTGAYYDLRGLRYFLRLLCVVAATRMSSLDVVCCRETNSASPLFSTIWRKIMRTMRPRRDASLALGVLAVLTALACSSAIAPAQNADKKTDLAIRPEFREPIVLTSKDGVLEVRLTARQGRATLDTVATPVQNFLLFDYEVIRGTASNGQKSAAISIPRPRSRSFPAKG